jgi:hypothetical protein
MQAQGGQGSGRKHTRRCADSVARKGGTRTTASSHKIGRIFGAFKALRCQFFLRLNASFRTQQREHPLNTIVAVKDMMLDRSRDMQNDQRDGEKS